ncbi:MAG TPA: sulfate ABC transporter permease subunit CysT [Tepidisphaeraceae bacterium]|jgi:sulfate transport system permease protein|nr:sulfate ABC transporter permease subunit CysT [Tepidisphaeraceae bacterium]
MASRKVIPGFGLSLGYTVLYLSIIVLLPLSALFVKTATMGWGQFWELITSDEVMEAYRFSFGASLLAAFINIFIGLLIAWVLARYAFPGKRFVDAVIDLPFALPTAVAGIALTALYSERGWIGSQWAKTGWQYPWPTWAGFSDGLWPIGLEWHARIALAPLGVVIALMFVGLPFIVRTIQPVLEDLSKDVEEAAASLGAGRLQTFWRVILPATYPAIVTGFALSFARALGEYGSVIFITGNMPGVAIAPQLIIEKLEQYNYAGATAIAVVLLIVSFGMLLVINIVQRFTAERVG